MQRLPSSSTVLMACTPSSLTVETSHELSTARSTGTSPERQTLKPRRRASSYRTIRRQSNVRRYSADLEGDAVFIKVNLFLSELDSRLDWLENYGNLKLDAGINRAYATLAAVRDSCSQVSGELMDAGRKRAKVLVEVLESRYKDALATKETLESKAQASIRLMDGFLSEFEYRAQTVRDASFTKVMDEGWRRAEEGLRSAREAVDEGVERVWRVAKDSLKENIDHAVKRAKEVGLITYEELPHPWRVNPHITKGYRFSSTKVECVRSAFSLSNESFNIWSHAIGLLIVLSIAFYYYPASVNFSHSSKTDIFFSAMFFFAACKCLICSCMWHTMNSIADQTLMERFACVDYTGISLLIAASIMTTEYTAFYCEPVSRWIYIITTGILGVGGVILPWHPTFNRADMAWARVTFYVALGATGFAPVIQLNLTRGSEWSYYFYAPVMKSVSVYLVGAIIYAMKLPEMLLPGWFDYVGGSHNIWHCSVLFGILFHYLAVQDFFTGAFQRAENGCSLY